MNKTLIEWVKNPDGTQGYTWNPITGCLNGCDYCYARKLANTRLKERYLANDNIANAEIPFYAYKEGAKIKHQDPFYPRFWPEKLVEFNPYKHKHPQKSKGIFVCDMSDLFGIGVPEQWTRKVLDCCEEYPEHRFYLLTKQPQNLVKWDFPDSCWVGQTITGNTDMFLRLDNFYQVKAKVKYISFEPLLEQLNMANLGSYLNSGDCQWVIIGSQTKPYKAPKIEWVKEIVEACDKAGISVFLKDNLKPLIKAEWDNPAIAHLIYHAGTHFSGEIQLRQEFPNGVPEKI